MNESTKKQFVLQMQREKRKPMVDVVGAGSPDTIVEVCRATRIESPETEFRVIERTERTIY